MTRVAVIGGGVVGAAVARALALAGVETTLLERLERLAGGASGGNSGILHTGFDSPPGELESRLIQRGAELREGLIDTLGVPVWRCGARMTPRDDEQRAAVLALQENARAAGVETALEGDALRIPGESVTDPVLYTRALAGTAVAAGAELRMGARVVGLEARGEGLAVAIEGAPRPLRVEVVVNCAGLYADEVARLVGDDRFAIYPRKGEFLVFGQPSAARLEEILLPIPSKMGKGVLVFPTVDGHVVAGPTAREREDKEDRSVEHDARELILARAFEAWPALAELEPVAAYAGLRPAGREVNYLIELSPHAERVLHVAAIRSTGLSACLGIAEHVLGMLAGQGLIAPARDRVPRWGI